MKNKKKTDPHRFFIALFLPYFAHCATLEASAKTSLKTWPWVVSLFLFLVLVVHFIMTLKLGQKFLKGVLWGIKNRIGCSRKVDPAHIADDVPAHICPGIYWSAAIKDVSFSQRGICINPKKCNLGKPHRLKLMFWNFFSKGAAGPGEWRKNIKNRATTLLIISTLLYRLITYRNIFDAPLLQHVCLTLLGSRDFYKKNCSIVRQ